MHALSMQQSPPKTIVALMRKGVRVVRQMIINPHSTDEDSRRREFILNIILVGSIVLLLFLDATVIRHAIALGSRYVGISPIAFSLIPLFFMFLLFLSRRGFFVIASYLLIATYLLTITYTVIRWGVYVPTPLLGYALIIVMAGILLGTRSGFVLTGIIVAFITPLWYLQAHGLISVESQRIDGSDGLVFGALYAIIMLITWLSNREIERSLIRARTSEAALKQERDLLDVTVTERTRELREAQFEKVEQIYRFAEFGRLATGLFHDLLNVLNAFSLRVDENAEDVPGDGTTPHRPFLDDAFDKTKQIEHFMYAIRLQLDHRESMKRFSLNEAISQIVQLVSYKANKEHVRIVFDHLATSDIAYFGDPMKFHQVILNLVLNGIDAHEKIPPTNSSRHTVTVNIEDIDGVAIIHVRDNGCGIPKTAIGKIFDPFFSTKSSGKGMGIGLASVKKIIEESLRGTIAVESREGLGSDFLITFPLASLDTNEPIQPTKLHTP
jgi:signal transduction histidine kinase